MTQYMLSVYMEGKQPTEEEMQQAFKDVDALNAEMEEEGAWVFGGGLHPADTATVLRMKGDDVVTTDGPFAETKESVGGFWVIEAKDLDEALAWAHKATRACLGTVEVRPFQDD